MLRHVVAFNFKSDVPQELIDKILDEARTALPTIPGVSNVVVGPQTSDWTNYKYGVSIDLKDKEAKAVYANSAESKRLHEQFKQYVESEVVIDIFNE
ncbi:MAG: Dabb family protein [Acidobacteria bacterium]|nr:Dabb family protein [Acidobacteriota bacterium]MCW5970062.1 Dabb family protein [Blastocatellales bacterium]